MLVGRLGPLGKKVCLVMAYALMLLMCWMLFSGSLEQTKINWDVTAPSSGASMAWFYSVGLVFGVSAAAVLLVDLVQGADRCTPARPTSSMVREEAGMTILVFVGSLLAAMAIGIPISFALLVCGAALMWQLGMLDPQILAQNLINGANSYPLLAVPFFLLAGELMNVGGLSRRIVNVALVMVGHVKGGLGYVVIIAACLLAAMSGSAVADAAALTTLLLPMMVAAGHDKARSAGLIASAGIIAPILPPSIGFVIFGVAANVSISKLFLAGIVPGPDARRLDLVHLVVAGAQRRHRLAAAAPVQATCSPPSATPAWALGLPVIIIVGLKFGVFTPTEAGVVAAVYALFVSTVVYRELKLEPALRRVRPRRPHHLGRDAAGRRGRGQRLADHGGEHSGARSSPCCSRCTTARSC